MGATREIDGRDVRRDRRAAVVPGLVLAAVSLVAGCGHSPAAGDSLALEACDPAARIPCIQPVAFVPVLVSDAGLYLTYSSRWIVPPANPRANGVESLGLGGFDINVVQRYDAARRILFRGDGSWRLTDAVSLPDGGRAVPSWDGSEAYIFDAAGRHVRTVDGRLGTVLLRIAYDSVGRLSRVDGSVDGQLAHVIVRRDSDGRPIGLVGMDGGTTPLDVDAAGRLVTVTDPAGSTTRIGWDSAGRVTSRTDALGGTIRYTYDASGHLASEVDADGVAMRYERRASAGRLEVLASTALGRRWSYRAETTTGGGIRRTFVAPGGTADIETTAAHGSRVVQLADGTRFTIGATPHPTWGMAAPILTPIVERRSDGVTSRTDVRPDLHARGRVPYELAGSIKSTVNGRTWTRTFDPSTRTSALVDPAGRRTVSTYDAAGRLLSFAAPGRAPIAYAYDDLGRETRETVGTGERARTTRYAYDASTGEIRVTLPDGNVQKTTVDRAGETVTASAGDGSTVLTAYDAAGRLLRVQPAGGLSFTLGTSPAGRPTAFVPPPVKGDASIERRAYDSAGELESIRGPGERSVDLSYDSAGRLASWSFDRGKGTASYDSATGLRTRATDPDGVTTLYGYAGSRLDRLAWSGPVRGSVSDSLDADGHAVSETVNGGHRLDFAYDRAGRLVRVGPLSLTRDSATGLVTGTALGAVRTSRAYDDDGRLTRSTTEVSGRPLLDLRYARDALGRIASVTETGADGKPVTTAYSYDRAGRLAGVRVGDRPVEADAYDPAGNRVAVVRDGHRVEATYDDRDRILTRGQARYSWTAGGGLARVADGGRATTLGYDDFGALREARLPGGRKAAYLVDADGRRVGLETGGKVAVGYLFRPEGTLAAETDGAGKIVARFGYDDEGHVALLERGGVPYRVVTDALGSPRLVVDSRTGAIADAIGYDAWGRETRNTATAFLDVGFAGGLRDPDTGLIRFGARDYDPQVGRWTAADPIGFGGGDADLYRYVGDDPVNASDASGLSRCRPVIAGGGLYGIYVVIGTTLANCLPPSNNKPPSGGNAPAGGGTPPDRHPITWSCSSSGVCLSPNKRGGDRPGCYNGACGGGPNGFWCKNAEFCNPGNAPDCEHCTGTWGDPHALTADGLHFDFQAAGEFLAASANGGKDLIQARQEPWFSGAPVAVNTAVTADVDGDRVGIYAREPSFLLVNDRPIPELELLRRLPHGGTVERRGGTVDVGWKDGSRLRIAEFAGTLSYAFTPGPGAGTPMSGLLGNADGSGRALVARDGRRLASADPAFPSKLYKEVGDSWRIKPSESLFHYWPGESPATFTKLDFPPRIVSADSLTPAARSNAEATCRAVGVRNGPTLDDCVLDVGMTGIPALAAASAGAGPAAPAPALSASAASPPSAQAPPAPAPRALPPAPAPAPAAPSDDFSIRIGDTVSPDRPASGAGRLTRAAPRQSYAFSGRKGQVVYVGLGPCEGAQPDFDLRAPDGSSLASSIANCRGAIGRQVLPATGTYRMIARVHESGATSRYGFSLRTVPADRHFAVRLPLTVSPGVPTAPAGHIAAPGAEQLFDFSASAGTVVHIEGRCAATCAGLAVRVAKAGKSDDYGYLGLDHLRFDWTLPETGKYTIQVRSDGYTGRYGFAASKAGPRPR